MMPGLNPLKPLFLLTAFISITGCAFNAPPRITGPDTHVIIRAAPDTMAPASLAIFKLKGPREYEPLRKALSQFAHRKLIGQGFPKEVVLMESAASNETQAAEAAAGQHIEWVFWGEIEEYRYGGVMGTSKVTLSLKLLDAATADPVWYLVGTMTGKGRVVPTGARTSSVRQSSDPNRYVARFQR